MNTRTSRRPVSRGSVVFLGAGTMAEALIRALVANRALDRRAVTATDVSAERRSYVKRTLRVNVTADNERAVAGAGVVIVAVKPQQVEDLLCGVGLKIPPSTLVISIAAGITTRFIERFLPSKTPVVRAMPNTPALVGEAAVALCRGRYAAGRHLARARELFSPAGLVVELPESRINAVTALSGSGPAYVFYLAEAMERAGREMGLSAGVARMLTRQTILGSGVMLARRPEEAALLRHRVMSPGGTTEAAVRRLESRDTLRTFVAAIRAARKRAQELAR